MTTTSKPTGRQQILVARETAHQILDDEFIDDAVCPDCDCLLEQFYDDQRGNPKYICDNCGVLVQGPVTMLSDMDITK
jgi:hypothetical protein